VTSQELVISDMKSGGVVNMPVLPRILLIVLSGLIASQATADVVELSVQEWGPLMPLGPGESGRMLIGSGPTAKLDAHLISVDVVHAEKRDVATVVDGRNKTIKTMYYFVRICVNKDGARKLRDIQTAVVKQTKKAGRTSSIDASLRIADTGQGYCIVYHDGPKTAELRVVLFEQQLLPLMDAVRKDWKDTKEGSTINLWVDGKIDVLTPADTAGDHK
jgi:hypothetical protein